MEKYNNKKNIIFNPNKVQKWNVEKILSLLLVEIMSIN